MERRYLRAVVGLALVAPLFGGCGGTDPLVHPTTPSPAAAVPTPPPANFGVPIRVVGGVSDTAWRGLGDARVEVLTGPEAGMVTTTDENGHFSMPETFSAPFTLMASKDGYSSRTNSWPNGRMPPSEPKEVTLWFYLQPLGPSANLVGKYTWTLTADRACTGLPADARTRTYTATIVPGPTPTNFLVRLSDARFLPTYDRAVMVVAGDFVSFGSWDPYSGQSGGAGIVERLGETGYVAIEVGGGGSFGPSGMTAPFGGYFEYCPAEMAVDGNRYRCLATKVQCDSDRHQLTLVRR